MSADQTTLDELFAEIGYSLIPQSSGGERYGIGERPKESIQQLVQKGKEWFSQEKVNLQKVVCSSKLREAISNSSDKVTAATLIADAVSAIHLGVPPFTIGKLLIKMGIDKFCETCDN